MDNDGIIELFINRSESAITEVKKKYGNLCRKVAHNILSNHADVEECVNDTYLKAWSTIPPQKPKSLSAYLCKITRNLALHKYEYYHAQKRDTRLDVILSELEECIPDNSSVESQLESGQISKAISDFLATTNSITRAVFVRRYFMSESITEISKKFKFSKSKVESMLHRTRLKLKEYLLKEGIAL